jgi:hypothetical protein
MVNETDEAFAAGGHTMTWKHHFRPVRVDVDGEWEPVDTTLEVKRDGSVGPKMAAVEISFSPGGTKQLASVGDAGDQVAIDSPIGDLPQPTLNGEVATYPEVLPGVDLQLRADVEGFAQLLVVKNAEAAKDPRLKKLNFPIRADGLTPKKDSAGNVDFVDGQGREKFSSPTPSMWDDPAQSATREDRPHTRGGAGHQKSVPINVTASQISVTPDSGILTNPDTVFPVYIDPGLIASKSAWTMVDSGSPSTSYWNSSGEAQVGTPNGGANVRRSFFNMNVGATPLAGKTVTAAWLVLTETYSYSCTARQFDVWSTNNAVSTTTWSHQPTWSNLQSSATVASGFSSACPSTQNFMLVTPTVQAAAAGSWSSLTLGIRSPNETDNSYYKRFNNNPYLTVNYDVPPALTARSTDPASTCTTGTGRPTINSSSPALAATFTSSDASIITTTFEWWQVTGTAAIGTQTMVAKPGSETGVVIPHGDLSNGGIYKWRVRAADDYTTSAWSSWCEFAVSEVADSPDGTVVTDPQDQSASSLSSCIDQASRLGPNYVWYCSPTGLNAVNPTNSADTHTDSMTATESDDESASPDVSVYSWYPSPAEYDSWCEGSPHCQVHRSCAGQIPQHY